MTMTIMTSKYQLYWSTLKQDDPVRYEARLEQNRTRIKNRRHAIYADKKKHDALKKKNREYYANVVSARRKAKRAALKQHLET